MQFLIQVDWHNCARFIAAFVKYIHVFSKRNTFAWLVNVLTSWHSTNVTAVSGYNNINYF